MKKILLPIFFFLLIANSFAQVTEDWIRTANVYSKTGTYVTRDASDNAYVTSHDVSIWLKKYDAAGTQLWEVSSSTSIPFNYEKPVQVHVDPQGNPVVVAYRYTLSSDGHNANSLIVLKYDAGGNFIYKQYFNGSYSHFNNSQYWTKVTSQMDANGNLFIGTAGNVTGYPDNGFNAIKVLPTGTIAWVSTKTFPLSNFHFVNNIRLKGDKLGLAGTTVNAYANATSWVLDTTGADNWNAVSVGVQGKDIVFDNSGNGYVLTSISALTSDVAIYKFDGNGNPVWNQTYDFGTGELSSQLEFTPDGNLAVMAYGNTAPTSWYTDWITMKVNLNGTLLWWHRYDQHVNNDELPYMMVVDQFSNVYVTGIGGPFPGGPNLGKRQMVTVKYNAAGSLLWTAVKDTFTEYNTGISIALDSQNGLYVLGSDWSILIHYLDQTITAVAQQQSYTTLTIFPNPANNVITLNGLEIKDIFLIEIFDVEGRLIYASEKNTSNEIRLKISEWKNGIYMLRAINKSGEIYFSKFQKE